MVKEKGNYYLKVLFTALIVILVITVIISVIEVEFDKKYEQIKKDVLNEYYRCEFSYKELSYKGICSEDILERAEAFIEFDMKFKIFEKCINLPYAYRNDACKDAGVN